MISNKHFNFHSPLLTPWNFSSCLLYPLLRRDHQHQLLYRFKYMNCCVPKPASNNSEGEVKQWKNNKKQLLKLHRLGVQKNEQLSSIASCAGSFFTMLFAHIKINIKNVDKKFLNYDCLLCLFERAKKKFFVYMKNNVKKSRRKIHEKIGVN